MIWKLGFWNEPELQTFWPGTMEEYMEMYLRACQILRAFRLIRPLLPYTHP
ncbi:hypothetical protein ABU162_18400 [Paenibacillus thiaminolyticus]|uniref:hypothetical protein n=1 Tax=Paenibacillus thiaminolyticus TaxID=49283 RepID=UPI0035A60E94